MIAKLKELESSGKLLEILSNPENLKTLDVDYHPPRVERLWAQVDEHHRIYFHLIHPCKREEALYHPHPWPSAMHLLSGGYEMGLSCGEVGEGGHEVSKLLLPAGTYYEMLDTEGWHYVRPVNEICASVMLTGKPWDKWQDKKSSKKLEAITLERAEEIRIWFWEFYRLGHHSTKLLQ